MLESFTGALFLALVLFAGWRVTPELGHGRRRLASASAGVAVAYVFVYMLPELDEAGEAFVDAAKGIALPFPEYRVYTAALVGFVLMYGVEHLRIWSRTSPEAAGESREMRTFRLHVGGFALYAALVAFAMAESASHGELPVALYCIAMGLHFVGAAGDLYVEHGALYMKPGRQLLAGAVLGGWVLGALVPVPPITYYTLLGLISGGVVVNSMLMELPGEKDGRFWPFVTGAVAYSIVLLLLARVRVSGAEAPAYSFTALIIDRFAARLTGPLHFRFVMQPLMAIALGVRDGRLDAKAGTSPFVVDVLFGAENRGAYVLSALRHLAMPVIIGTILDAISQYQLFGHVRPLAALFVGFGILGLPYALARGISNRMTNSRHGAPTPSAGAPPR
jgi:hypothetical protein